MTKSAGWQAALNLDSLDSDFRSGTVPRIARGDKFQNDTASAVSLTPPFGFAFAFLPFLFLCHLDVSHFLLALDTRSGKEKAGEWKNGAGLAHSQLHRLGLMVFSVCGFSQGD